MILGDSRVWLSVPNEETFGRNRKATASDASETNSKQPRRTYDDAYLALGFTVNADWSKKEDKETEKEEGGGGGWRKRTEGDSEGRRPVPDREWRQEGREEEKEDREGGFRREGLHRAGDDRAPRRGFGDDDDRAPRRGMDEDRAPRRGFDDDRAPRRAFDDDRGSFRRGFDDDRGPRRAMDDSRGSRRGADDDWGPRRGGDDERGGRRGVDDGPRRGADVDEKKPWKPLSRPAIATGGWREREKARQDSWGPPRYNASEDREDDKAEEKNSDNWRDRPVREESTWRRAGAEQGGGSWRRGGEEKREERPREVERFY